MNTIVFITRLPLAEQQIWLTTLTTLMPNERIVLPNELTDRETLTVDIAIVANPDVEVLARFPHLQWVQSLWAGVETLIPYFKKYNENHTSTLSLVRLIDPQLSKTMAEAVLAWTLYLHRNMPAYSKQQRDKLWRPVHCPAASQVRVSILGAGELGQAAMQTLLQQGYQVNGWSRQPKVLEGVTHYSGESGLKSLLQKTDILVCLLPLTPQTHHLLNEKTLMLLPKGAKFINFARGGIVNQDDLQRLLKAEFIDHAVLDVFEQEPLQASSPLWEDPNITVLPHISATTDLESASRVVASNIHQFREEGQIPQRVDLINAY